MKTPGVEVKPIITIDGSHEVNMVYLDNVKVPVEFLIQTLNLFNAVNCVNTTVAVFDVTSSLTTSPGAGK